MKDDYLWDASGEPDPEVEHLEKVLSKYRYEPRPVEMPVRPRPMFWPQLAAAAVLLLALLAGLWFALMRNNDGATNPNDVANENRLRIEEPKAPKENQPAKEGPKVARDHDRSNIAEPRKRKTEIVSDRKPRNRFEPGIKQEPAIVETTETIAFLDIDTVRHIEKAQMLLRSFRNVSAAEGESAVDVSYEREQSRALLNKNILLRRDAQAKGNLPVEELLSGLEPFLLDIANLPDRSSSDSVRSIKEQIQNKEIVATLQVYSAPALARAY